MRAMPFGMRLTYPVPCIKCGGKTFRCITRDRGLCAACEDVPRTSDASATSGASKSGT